MIWLGAGPFSPFRVSPFPMSRFGKGPGPLPGQDFSDRHFPFRVRAPFSLRAEGELVGFAPFIEVLFVGLDAISPFLGVTCSRKPKASELEGSPMELPPQTEAFPCGNSANAYLWSNGLSTNNALP